MAASPLPSAKPSLAAALLVVAVAALGSSAAAAAGAAAEAAPWPADAAARSFGPVIAMLTQPVDLEGTPSSYLTAWYVRWVEAQGARVVPLRYDAPEEEVAAMLDRVNGVLFPGGPTEIIYEDAAYGQFSRRVFEIALRNRMPVWGTCLGFEQLMLYSSGEQFPGPLTEGWDAMSYLAPLNLTDKALSDGAPMFVNWPESLRAAAAEHPWTWHFHQLAVSVGDFARRPALGKFWDVLATNVDRRGLEFVSVAQAKSGLPVFATQFHPEKNANEFEIPLEVVNGSLPVHCSGAIRAMGLFAEFFVNQARAFRKFGFTEEEFWRVSIANWPPRLARDIHGMSPLWPRYEQFHIFARSAAQEAMPPLNVVHV